jgi:hypothetical protein
MTVKCGGHVHEKGTVEITVSRVSSSSSAARTAAEIGLVLDE